MSTFLRTLLVTSGCAALWAATPALASADLDCDLSSQSPCTLSLGPGGGAAVALRAPGTQFKLAIDGSGFEISGRVELLGSESALSGVAMTEALLVVEYADPSQPSAGFRRLRGSAVFDLESALGGQTGMGLLEANGSYSRRMDVGIELGSVLQSELGIAHLNPQRPCQGLNSGDAGFQECPYWIFQYVEEQSVGLGFGGTDLGLQLSAEASATNKVLYLMDPEDFFVYLGITTGALDSVSLGIESTSAAPEPDRPGNDVDHGIGFSQHGYIPFEVQNTWGIEDKLTALDAGFEGHLVIDWKGLPIAPIVTLDGSYVFRLPVDEVTGDAQWDSFRAAASGVFDLTIPFFGDALNWSMRIGDASAGIRLDDEQQSFYISGYLGKEVPWAPEALPLSLDFEQSYRAAAVLVNDVDPHTSVPGINLTNSHVQAAGIFLLDLQLGAEANGLGGGLATEGFLRADFDNGFTFSGSLSQDRSATAIHPLIQTEQAVAVHLHMNPFDLTDQLIELSGAFGVGDDAFVQQGVLRITTGDAYLGFPLSFDPSKVQQAYQDIQQATQDAEAEVNRLNALVDHERAIVRAERDAQQADLRAAEADLADAQAEVNRLNAAIAKYKKDISYYKGRIGSWYRWYKKQPWYKRASAYARYLSKKAYYNGLIASRYTAIAGAETAKGAATLALNVASAAVSAARAALVVTPIDADPRVAAVLLPRDAALAVLNGLQDTMPVIPTIPGTIQATFGYRIGGNGLSSEARADYCTDTGCVEIRGGEYDKEAGRACIHLPEQGNPEVCTVVPRQS